MAKIVPPTGFKSWYFINANIYAIQLTSATQFDVITALKDRFANGKISVLNLTLKNPDSELYSIQFCEKTGSKIQTLNNPDYLVLQTDDTLTVMSEEKLREEYTDKLESGIYLDQGAVLRI